MVLIMMENLENARDPITHRLSLGMIGNLVPNFLDKDVREDNSKHFFNKKIRKLITKDDKHGR